jgi:hypothetical protein
MRAAQAEKGYALLMTLVIAALAGVFAATCVVAVSARQHITAADAALSSVRGNLAIGLDRVCYGLREQPLQPGDSRSERSEQSDSGWEAVTAVASPTETDGWPVAIVDVEAKSRGARRGAVARVELRADPLASGVNVSRDVDLRAPTRITGSGLYCGGSVRERENLTFGPEGEIQNAAADHVRGGVWPVAGVHAVEGIWANGREIHESTEGANGEYPADTDTHAGGVDDLAVCGAPDVCLLAALKASAGAPDDALVDGRLDTGRLPVWGPSGGAPDGGRLVVVDSEAGGPIRIVGERSPAACPLALVVDGDATLGQPGQTTSFRGALVVVGALTIDGSSTVRGHLFADELVVLAPLSVETPANWRLTPLPGLIEPVIVGRDGAKST